MVRSGFLPANLKSICRETRGTVAVTELPENIGVLTQWLSQWFITNAGPKAQAGFMNGICKKLLVGYLYETIVGLLCLTATRPQAKYTAPIAVAEVPVHL